MTRAKGASIEGAVDVLPYGLPLVDGETSALPGEGSAASDRVTVPVESNRSGGSDVCTAVVHEARNTARMGDVIPRDGEVHRVRAAIVLEADDAAVVAAHRVTGDRHGGRGGHQDPAHVELVRVSTHGVVSDRRRPGYFVEDPGTRVVPYDIALVERPRVAPVRPETRSVVVQDLVAADAKTTGLDELGATCLPVPVVGPVGVVVCDRVVDDPTTAPRTEDPDLGIVMDVAAFDGPVVPSEVDAGARVAVDVALDDSPAGPRRINGPAFCQIAIVADLEAADRHIVGAAVVLEGVGGRASAVEDGAGLP